MSTLLKNYQPISIDGEFLVLNRKAVAQKPHERSIFTINAKSGERISIPKDIDGYLFARIFIDPTAWWQIAQLLYKPPHFSIIFVVNGKITIRYRFISSTAKNGAFLMEFIDNPGGLPMSRRFRSIPGRLSGL